MRLRSTSLLLLSAACGVTATAPYTTNNGLSARDSTLSAQKNYNGWVNPEDLTPMPQCIAQQNPSSWLQAMTRCTRKRCTSHFGIICTHGQWLTDLSCLSAELSPRVVQGYMAYCSRSVLGKAQLYYWIRSATGRSWLVDVGDANGLQNLSPASLSQGYANANVVSRAPSCLADSNSTPSKESFKRIMTSCSFTDVTRRTGNARRPWEYNVSMRSMTALGVETVGYNLTGHYTGHGEYFDRACFCHVFATHPEHEACSGQSLLDVTAERLWINATYGPNALPSHWSDNLKTMGFAYIQSEDWHWPACYPDLPKRVGEQLEQCTTDACEIDPSGYCRPKPAIDRTCFCRDLSYETCGDSCQEFETRIEYVGWLHDVCGNVQGWEGLPDDWRRLAELRVQDMTPWRWTVKPSNGSSNVSAPDDRPTEGIEDCASDESKIGSLVLVNLVTSLAILLIQRGGNQHNTNNTPSSPHPWRWFFVGIFIAAIQLLANYVNGTLIQQTRGFEHVPVIQLTLLWCSMPRLGWLTAWMTGSHPVTARAMSASASCLFAEVILQALSSYYMLMTIDYGIQHDFYTRSLANAERGTSARIMYVGAPFWLVLVVLTLVRLTATATRPHRRPVRQGRAAPNLVVGMMVSLDEGWAFMEERLADCWTDGATDLKERPPPDSGEAPVPCVACGHIPIKRKATQVSVERDGLLRDSQGALAQCTGYGTIPIERKTDQVSAGREWFVKGYAVIATSMPFLWLAQWLFWGGYLSLASDQYCPPKLGVLTAVWILSSLVNPVYFHGIFWRQGVEMVDIEDKGLSYVGAGRPY